MMERPLLYFPRDIEWRAWLHDNHEFHAQGIYLILYKLELNVPTMRWEEAVKVALCYGWIDSTVKSLGDGKRQQYFCPRNPKSYWSALNKNYITELEAAGLIHESGWKTIELAKEKGTWSAMDDVENLIVPDDLMSAFQGHPLAYSNYMGFAPGYRKSYLSWLFQANVRKPVKKEFQKSFPAVRQGLNPDKISLEITIFKNFNNIPTRFIYTLLAIANASSLHAQMKNEKKKKPNGMQLPHRFS